MLNAASKALINAPYMLSTVEGVKKMSVDAIQKTLKAYHENPNYGIGRALLETLINWAKNNSKIEKVCLEVMEDNLGAIQLYKNLGFFEEGRKAKGVKLDDGYQNLILMALFV
ncbi:N-acetyltransferase [Bacillus toyonensis]|nr:N-acetyltransferase [Bacillus toyonensis]